MIPYNIYEYAQLIKFVIFILFIVFATIDVKNGKLSNKIGILLFISSIGKPFYSGYAISFLLLGIWLLGEKYKDKLSNSKISKFIKNKNSFYYFYIPLIISMLSQIVSLIYFYYPEDLQLNFYTVISVIFIYMSSFIMLFVAYNVWNLIVTLVNKIFRKDKTPIPYAKMYFFMFVLAGIVILV